VNTVAECTVPEKILLAASQLESEGKSPFSAEDLIVESWEKFPRTFGLKGYAEKHPDSNKILSSIMGEKGLARRGWLVKMGQKLYALTREGRQVVRRLLDEEGDEEADEPAPAVHKKEAMAPKLSREHEKFIQALLESSAVEKYMEGRKGELNFADATRFWDLKDHLHGDAVDGRLAKLRATLGDIERQVGAKGATLASGRHLASEDLSALCDVHNYMEQRFKQHLTLLRSRNDRE
jgi:hypothetical protein